MSLRAAWKGEDESQLEGRKETEGAEFVTTLSRFHFHMASNLELNALATKILKPLINIIILWSCT